MVADFNGLGIRLFVKGHLGFHVLRKVGPRSKEARQASILYFKGSKTLEKTVCSPKPLFSRLFFAKRQCLGVLLDGLPITLAYSVGG